jgi:hypothetical protein
MIRCRASQYRYLLSAVSATTILLVVRSACLAQTTSSNGPGHLSTSNASARTILHDPDFGSPFHSTPFTMGDVLRSHGQLPPINTLQSHNSASCLAIPGNQGQSFIGSAPRYRNGWLTYNLGTLGIVSPGWAGYPYYSPFYYGPTVWGYPAPYQSWGFGGYYNPYLYYNSGLPYGWAPFWIQPVNRLVPNHGLIFSMAEIVNRGNARFGPARPVRQLRKANGNPNNGGIMLPGAEPANNVQNLGMKAFAPIHQGPLAQAPADPLKSDLATQIGVSLPTPAAEQAAESSVNLKPRSQRANTAQKRDGKVAFSGATSDQSETLKLRNQLQTADRLARNGLFDEARSRYQEIAKREPSAPEPWLRIAQIEVLAGNRLPALSAWQQFQMRSGRSETGYTKKLRWNDIADDNSRAEAAENLKIWAEQNTDEAIVAIKATMSTAARLP